MASDLPGADSFWQSQRLRIFTFVGFFIGIFLLALGAGLFLFKGAQEAGDIQIISQEASPNSEIFVHVDGSVKTPGVYKLANDSRTSDAVAAAGGFSDNADTKNVNLAAKITDGQKIYIPIAGESKGASIDQSSSALVNINSASQAQLESLPAIGPVTAQKIIASRPYSTSEDLLTKKVVGSSTFEKIKDLISVY